MGNFFTKYKKINDENDKKVIYVKMKFNNGENICYSGDKAIEWYNDLKDAYIIRAIHSGMK
jgi:hypothetical protein